MKKYYLNKINYLKIFEKVLIISREKSVERHYLENILDFQAIFK